MNIAGMHGVSARNLGVNTVTNVTGVNAGILLFPQSVNAVDLEAAFDGDYSSFIKDHCVGYINCTTTVTHYDEYSEVKYTAVDYECSGVGFALRSYDFIAEDATKTMVTVEGVEFYYPQIFKYEDFSYSGGSSSIAYTVDQLNAVASDYTYAFDLAMSATINRLMNVDSTNPSFTVIQGWYSSGSNRVYKDLLYYGFNADVTVDTLITKFVKLDSVMPVAQNSIQLFAKVSGSWVLVMTSTYEILTRDVPLVRKFSAVTAREWRIGIFGAAEASVSGGLLIGMTTFMLGNSAPSTAESTVVDKAVIVPAAALAKYSDPAVESAGPIPAIFASAGPAGEVGLFSESLTKGDRIPFIESTVRLGV